MKIAFVAGYYFFDPKTKIDEDLKIILDALYTSAKKHFLKNHDVDFIFLTNGQDEVENVKNIHFDYEMTGSAIEHTVILQILSLKYLTDNYDYIFIHDHDLIYVNDVDENLLLNSDFVMLDHFWKFSTRIDHLLPHITTVVDMQFDLTTDYWTMSSFYGGKSNLVNKLVEKSWEWHEKYLLKNNGLFYAKYPAEVFLIKFIFENKINHKRLNAHNNPCCPSVTEKIFFSNLEMLQMTNLQQFEEKVKNLTIVHGTKGDNFPLLKDIYLNKILKKNSTPIKTEHNKATANLRAIAAERIRSAQQRKWS